MYLVINALPHCRTFNVLIRASSQAVASLIRFLVGIFRMNAAYQTMRMTVLPSPAPQSNVARKPGVKKTNTYTVKHNKYQRREPITGVWCQRAAVGATPDDDTADSPAICLHGAGRSRADAVESVRQGR